MNKKKLLLVFFVLLILLAATVSTAGAQEAPIARAILFFSPNCGHCHNVIENVLIPMIEQYGDSLMILPIDVTIESGAALFVATLEEIGYPLDRAGVPFMLVGDKVMVGGDQIPDEFPGLVEEALKGEGTPWPSYQPIQEFLLITGYVSADGANITPTPDPNLPAPTTESSAVETPSLSEDPIGAPPEPTPTSLQVTGEVSTPKPEEPEALLLNQDTGLPRSSMIERFNHDTLGNGIAVGVLLWLVGVVIYLAVQFMRAANLKLWPEWVLPALLLIGLGIAVYLASVEFSGNEAVCGPVGDCNAVQSSEYAKLFGVLPVALLGVSGYVLIGAFWWIAKKTSGRLQFYAKLGMFLSALFGLLFFIYLTFLEPFVIGATCAWCISSAIIMSGINLFTLPVVLDAWEQIDLDGDDDAEEEDD